MIAIYFCTIFLQSPARTRRILSQRRVGRGSSAIKLLPPPPLCHPTLDCWPLTMCRGPKAVKPGPLPIAYANSERLYIAKFNLCNNTFLSNSHCLSSISVYKVVIEDLKRFSIYLIENVQFELLVYDKHMFVLYLGGQKLFGQIQPNAGLSYNIVNSWVSPQSYTFKSHITSPLYVSMPYWSVSLNEVPVGSIRIYSLLFTIAIPVVRNILK
ncbi:hypothetical protein AGLY_013839 [Aphis glycines]|uniref:Uncharacterized protein n=1 Tax=Aphis glycines TaxID=307491 RepID=A0A6G0T575_APHGL|nr:hypothetical protein AGLY_013839 [Aphis glycines]